MRNYKDLYYVSIKQETPTRFNRSFLEQGRNLNRLFICSYNYNGIFFSSINALLLQINTIQFCEMLGRFYCFKANQQWSLLSTRNPLYWYILKSLYNSWFVIHGIFLLFYISVVSKESLPCENFMIISKERRTAEPSWSQSRAELDKVESWREARECLRAEPESRWHEPQCPDTALMAALNQNITQQTRHRRPWWRVAGPGSVLPAQCD